MGIFSTEPAPKTPDVSKQIFKKTFTLTFETDCPYKLQAHLIRMARLNAGLNQQELADLLGESKRKIQGMEIHGADGVSLMKLIKILNLSVDYFFGE